MDNLNEQCEEIEALLAIYGDSFKIESGGCSYSMQVNPDIKFYINLTQDYPSHAPPRYELLAPTLNTQEKQQVADEFNKIYECNRGTPILYLWIEKLKDIANGTLETTDTLESNTNSVEADSFIEGVKTESEVRSWQVTHGDIIQDRKSVFQGHASPVHSQTDAKAFLSHLKENKKISQATHNISAYRITTHNGRILQDCDDDGEAHAGGRLMLLMQLLNVTNVMVVVSRWYGGIHLGADRFKHINNAARQVLVQGGFLPS